MISKEEWDDWKVNEVTKAFKQACCQRIDDCKELLATSAGVDSVQDNFFRGFIAAYAEMLQMRVEDIENED